MTETTTVEINGQQDFQALQALVVDNSDLEKLESLLKEFDLLILNFYREK